MVPETWCAQAGPGARWRTEQHNPSEVHLFLEHPETQWIAAGHRRRQNALPSGLRRFTLGQDPATLPDPLRPMPTRASGQEEHGALLARPMVHHGEHTRPEEMRSDDLSRYTHTR